MHMYFLALSGESACKQLYPRPSKHRHLAPRSWCPTSFSDERSQGFSEKLLILGLEQEIDKMILKHLTVPKSEEVLKIKPKTNKHDGGMSKEHRNQLEKVSVAKTETI